MKIQFILAFLLSVTVVFAGSLSKKEIDDLNRKVQILPDVAISPDDVVVIETIFGEIVFEFFPYVAPIHAMNFKKLISVGYFDSTTFSPGNTGFYDSGRRYSKPG